LARRQKSRPQGEQSEPLGACKAPFKDQRESLIGLAMWRGGAKRQTQPPKAAQGRADLRAPKRSARRRREAPKTEEFDRLAEKSPKAYKNKGFVRIFAISGPFP